VKSAKLVYGTGSEDVLVFAEPLAEPLDPAKGPAFRIEADAPVPLDDRRARMVAALQSRGAASWVVALEFEWARIVPPPPEPEPGPGPRPRPVPPHRPGVPVGTRPRPMVASRTMVMQRPAGAVAASAVAMQPASVMGRQAVFHEILVTPPARPRPQPTVQEKTILIERRLAAEYPKDSQENRPIFAAVSGDYAQIGWKNTAHGWFQPTPIRDTVYCLPDAYRLQVDAVTGLPSIHAVLLRKSEGGELVDDLDPRHYTVRLTLRARPDFDAERLSSLRALIRAESSNQIQYADLVLGGYSGARFIPDPALAGLGELFAGSSAGTREAIDPAEGFTLTYQGNAEFIDLLFQRLKGEGIEGTVELDLQEPGGTTRKQPVPVVLTLRRLAPVALPWTFATSPVQPPAGAPNPAALLPRDIALENPTGVEVKVGSLQAHALQKSPVTGRVDDWYRATADGTWPLTLAPAASRVIHLTVEGEAPLYNVWEIALVDACTSTSSELVLGSIFDAATQGVRGWKVAIECPPLAFFDQLTPEDKAPMQDVVAIEVEVRRAGSTASEEVRLTRQAPAGSVLLSRTVADFVSDRATGRSTFEYRQRVLRVTRAEEWSPWRSETGSAASVFLNQ
jgi:hypothetical protein